MEERLTIRTYELAEELGISEATVYRLMKQDPKFPQPVRIGRRVMWFRDDLTEYLRARQEEPIIIQRVVAKNPRPKKSKAA